jgi:Protein of unknown function (DUF1553)/Protein of unknown function (DUF1549)/Planctomycete cytochrome C
VIPSKLSRSTSRVVRNLLTASALSILAAELCAVPSQEVRYSRDVRAILSDRCFECHGSDPSGRKADLRLDQREHAIADRGGWAAIVPGDVEASEIWARITSDDPDEVMPPPSAKKLLLDEEQQAVIKQWITEGADYEEHWAFVAPKRPATPAVSEAAWGRNELDAFILARLESQGIQPSQDADRATLLRRIFLDLTGLPPTVEELEAYLADEAPDAYERQVQRLFNEEPYRSRLAERLATPWLDASRYADTCGIHMDAGRQAWHWRDWVLEALRDNMPYDQFVVEQLAGDLLPDASTSQLVATGFHRNQVTTDEGGAINEEYLVEYAVDRVNTTGAVFLGLTTGCARCHDHKYDPLTQKDFYSLYSFFNSIDQPGLYTQTADTQRAYEPFTEVPTDEQQERFKTLDERLEELRVAMEAPLPGEAESRASFDEQVAEDTGVAWSAPKVLTAVSSEEMVTLEIQPDDVVVASGEIPATEDYTFVLATEESSLRLLLLEALAKDAETISAGRADHGNAVINRITLAARPAGSDGEWTDVPLTWAWGDHTQSNGDFVATNVLEDDQRGWTVDAFANAGARTLILLAGDEFGYEGGSELRVVLSFRSQYAYHSLARVRFRVSPLASAARLPVGYARWYTTGGFKLGEGEDLESAYTAAYGPEAIEWLDIAETFGPDKVGWKFELRLLDEQVLTLANQLGAIFVARTLWSPDARELDFSLGSDDGVVIYLNGEQVFEERTSRAPAADQGRATLSLRPGRNTLIYRVVNTGGPSGYYFRSIPAEAVLTGALPSAVLPADAVPVAQGPRLTEAWRRRFFEGYRALDDESVAKRAERDALAREIPRAMVMKELATPRETFVLMRGEYDKQDKSRPVTSDTPGFLPPLPDDAPRDRLGLAQWLVAPENPLFARVSVNRLWQLIYGRGLVSTVDDFGLQGAWPSHPELLDWLAVEFRESGWDVHGMLQSFVLSSTYRQSSHLRPELAELDPENTLLAYYPRRRLGAEEIRDHALYTSGLLVEQLGGRSVKPYQPENLWKDVAMKQSNTRLFERGTGEDLWRRSLYTYWKRAAPPPSLLTFDAPTRESCVVQRQITNTPLQALVLWNDEQYVEAARGLALRTIASAESDEARLEWMLLSVASRAPDGEELAMLLTGLASFRERYANDEAAATELLTAGMTELPEGVEQAQLAAWTMMANAVLNLHETLTLD